MSTEELVAAAVEYIRGEHDAARRAHPADATYPPPVLPPIDARSPIVAMTLAHWAAYDEPAALPPGWTAQGSFPGPTGIHQYATAGGGGFYNDAPARRIPWTCPAGVLHRRYWRSAHHPNRPALVACEHQAEPVRLHVG